MMRARSPIRFGAAARHAAARADKAKQVSGFVIVGAVMFVLALTILGLSLFGLSSYEAQFLNRSLDEMQALYYAQSGIERSRFALSLDVVRLGEPHHLDQVNNAPSPYVTYAQAFQVQGSDTVSIGKLKWADEGGNPITLRVTATYKGATRTIESVFIPERPNESFYKRCITVADSMYVNEISGSSNTNRCETVVINSGQAGRAAIRLGTFGTPSDTAFVDCLLEYIPTFVEINALPKPNVNAFFSAHAIAPPPTASVSGSGPGLIVTYHFDTVSGVGYYTWANDPGDFSLWETRATTLSVTGTNVWMLGDGVRFDKRVHVQGPAGASLVIVGGRNGTHTYGPETYYEAGVWFFGGVESDIPLILVSDGQVLIEQYQDTNIETQRLPMLSIYASSAFITGPQTNSGKRLLMDYDPNSMDGLIDWLAAQGALPNASSNHAQFTMIPGSWRELASN